MTTTVQEAADGIPDQGFEEKRSDPVMDFIALGAYHKRSLADVHSPGELPVEFLLEWYKDTFDAPRSHTDEELVEMSRLPPASRLVRIEEMAAAPTLVYARING